MVGNEIGDTGGVGQEAAVDLFGQPGFVLDPGGGTGKGREPQLLVRYDWYPDARIEEAIRMAVAPLGFHECDRVFDFHGRAVEMRFARLRLCTDLTPEEQSQSQAAAEPRAQGDGQPG